MEVKVGVGVVIRRYFLESPPKVLIGKRKGSHGAGYWAFPGGHVEDDSFEECAKREVLEETGMKIKCIPVDNFGCDIFTTFDILAKNKRYSTTYLLAEWIKEEAQNLESHKCEQWEWKTLNEIKEMLSDEKSKIWIPIDRLIFHRDSLGL